MSAMIDFADVINAIISEHKTTSVAIYCRAIDLRWLVGTGRLTVNTEWAIINMTRQALLDLIERINQSGAPLTGEGTWDWIRANPL